MTDEAYSGRAEPHPALSDGAGAATGLTPSRRRRKPSPGEQARREAWGRKYAQLVKDVTAHIRQEG